jgi:hypothetical protein
VGLEGVAGFALWGSTRSAFSAGALSKGEEGKKGQSTDAQGTGAKSTDELAMDPERRAQLEKLRARDQEVRAHEAAHQAAAGGLAGAASFQYERGPDGKPYAVGGEVSIQASSVPNDPRATLAKAQRIQRAALAPADPSSQDRAVAGAAQAMATRAQGEIAKNAQSTGGGATKGQAPDKADRAAGQEATVSQGQSREPATSGFLKRMDRWAQSSLSGTAMATGARLDIQA